MDDLEANSRFHLVGYGCTTCIGNSGPAGRDDPRTPSPGADLVVTGVLSGNRNFEGRVSPDTRANYLASPPLVVAYALAGTLDIDFETDPIGRTPTAIDVLPPGHCGRTNEEITASAIRDGGASSRAVRGAATRPCSSALKQWQPDRRADRATCSRGRATRPTSASRRSSTGSQAGAAAADCAKDIVGARVLALLGDTVTTDHISPAGRSIKAGQPGGLKYLQMNGVVRLRDFNSYGSAAAATTR